MMSTLRFRPVTLLPVIDNDVVRVLALGVLSCLRGRARLAILRNNAPRGHCDFPIFLSHHLDSARVDLLQAGHVRIWVASYGIVLAIVFRAEFVMDRFAFGVNAVYGEFQSVGLGFNREGTFLGCRTWTVFRLGKIQFPGTGLMVGGLGNCTEHEHRQSQSGSEKREW